MFPAQVMQARVIPLLKKTTMDPDTTSSCPPISNLLYLSKLTERVVASRLTSHTSDFSLLPVQQSAHRPFHSTETAALCIHNNLFCSIDDSQVCPLVLLGVAFDTVDHQILLSVLSSHFSVTSTALSWFQSYLSDRTQTFHFAGSQSPAFPVDCSVPQASVLGFLEFRSLHGRRRGPAEPT